ncbi:MAG TPA: class I SAM-dependent methyltransferase [Thermoanaerobaculia bacterium]|nr:class I SAM-dependent methyltransferase [Thermoanaerobaculia bacterium]
MNPGNIAPHVNLYRRNLLGIVRPLLAPHAPVERALDFGCGDGLFAKVFQESGLAREVVAVDVQRRRRTLVEPLLYDGSRLPFADGSFDLVYALDVLHHCPDPRASLADLLRCSRNLVLLKDHTYGSLAGRATLAVLDEIGNRRFGVPSIYKYQRGWEWLPAIEEAGFKREALVHPAVCETRPPLSWFVNRLHFVGLWRRA